MVSWFTCQNRKFFGNRSYCNLSAVFTIISPRLSWIRVSLKLLLSVALNPLVVFGPSRQSNFIHRSFLIYFIFTQSKKLFLPFDFTRIIPEKYSLCKLIIKIVLMFFFSLSILAILTHFLDRREIIY
jgi:hypothetical protein